MDRQQIFSIAVTAFTTIGNIAVIEHEFGAALIADVAVFADAVDVAAAFAAVECCQGRSRT